jgi:hypothetical protein
MIPETSILIRHCFYHFPSENSSVALETSYCLMCIYFILTKKRYIIPVCEYLSIHIVDYDK